MTQEILTQQLTELEKRLEKLERITAAASRCYELESQMVFSANRVLFMEIVEMACVEFSTAFRVTRTAVLSNARPERIVVVRHVAMTLLRETGLTFQNIGALFDRDHGTVIYAVEATAERESISMEFKSKMDALRLKRDMLINKSSEELKN